jgi:starch phosphorylase
MNRRIEFKAVTNGIDLDKWTLPDTLDFYRVRGIIDAKNVVASDYKKKIAALDPTALRELKRKGRAKMNEILATRHDQNGAPVQIPDDALVFDFKRRFADYKRPEMPFRDPETLKKILVENNAHYILTGKVFTGDTIMAGKLADVLGKVAADDELRARVHYIADYDEEVATALSVGSDASINIPVVGREACGTSWEKDIANLDMLISTDDGGVADVDNGGYFKVTGSSEDEELANVYAGMRWAAENFRDDEKWADVLKLQLENYLPTISGPRMIEDYLKLLNIED